VRDSGSPRRGHGRGHARGASAADALFERALRGDVSETGRTFDARRDRTALQLCRQVQRALALALAGGSADALLRDLYVQSVEPMGGPGQLLVSVALPAHAGAAAAPAEVVARLAARTPMLRATIAREISRKRVPSLSFVVVPPQSGATVGPAPGAGREGGGHGK
jgi:ribosome-binding factor A